MNGKSLFIGEGTCGSCHALARAGTKGTQGPDLDEAFEQARLDGMTDETVEGVVHRQIGYPRRGSIMPADLVRATMRATWPPTWRGRRHPGEDTGALAEVGVKAGGKADCGERGPPDRRRRDGRARLHRQHGDRSGRAARVRDGEPVADRAQHRARGRWGGRRGRNGGTSQFKANLKPGKYTFVCTVPGHADGGMQGELTVK